MDKDELLIDIIHRLENKIDRIEKQVEDLTALKDKLLGIVAIGSILITLVVNYLQKVF